MTREHVKLHEESASLVATPRQVVNSVRLLSRRLYQDGHHESAEQWRLSLTWERRQTGGEPSQQLQQCI